MSHGVDCSFQYNPGPARQSRVERLAGFPKVSQLRKRVELPAGWVPKAGCLKRRVQAGKWSCSQLLQYNWLSKGLKALLRPWSNRDFAILDGGQIMTLLCSEMSKWMWEAPLFIGVNSLCCRNSRDCFSSFLCKQRVYKLQMLPIPLLSLMCSWVAQRESESSSVEQCSSRERIICCPALWAAL